MSYALLADKKLLGINKIENVLKIYEQKQEI
jgi:hypothetical protein